MQRYKSKHFAYRIKGKRHQKSQSHTMSPADHAHSYSRTHEFDNVETKPWTLQF